MSATARGSSSVENPTGSGGIIETPAGLRVLTTARSILLERTLAAERHEGILKRYGVPRDRSEDLNEAAGGA